MENIDIGKILMALTAVAGAIAAFIAAHRFFSPKREESPASLTRLAGEEKKELSSF